MSNPNKLLIKEVLEKAYSILSSSSDIVERQNAQDTIDKVVDLFGKKVVIDQLLSDD